MYLNTGMIKMRSVFLLIRYIMLMRLKAVNIVICIHTAVSKPGIPLFPIITYRLKSGSFFRRLRNLNLFPV